jgi:hypothetical protein
MKELIKLAREKGFDFDVFSFGEENEKGETTILSTSNDETIRYLWMCELQKWLRDKHNMYLIPYPDASEQLYMYDLWGNDIETCIGRDFDTYEEALESGLTEALKLI